MKFTLKDYQDEAVRDLLGNLRKARKRWHEDGDRYAFSLTATTGAGKTVMAAAAFEALFHGDDELDFDADPGAVVLWFSDDPSLNEQTRFRLVEASDRLNYSDLVPVDNSFNRERFEPGKLYFLNTQKLGKKSLLVRGHDPDDDGGPMFPETRPDLRAHTIWDTIQNTIEDPALTLYLVLDEAHRGMGNTPSEKSTIVKRLINGHGPVPAIPIVVGVSATVERFDKAMADAKHRILLSNVIVDSAKVQDSGLLKDTIILDIPDEVGHFDTVLVRRATDKIRESSKAWESYAKEQGETQTVKPLLVLQLPNTPDPNDVGVALDTIFKRWPELARDSIAHVLGDHKAQQFGSFNVPHISPEQVQDAKAIRILIAKDAISTGWDCPRAEVMVSFRPAKDRTHITQLLGRMVRTPLARRIPGNDRLNSVDCLLPFFDAKSVNAVADALMQGGDDGDTGIGGRRVLVDAQEMRPNPAIASDVWDCLMALPAQSLPKQHSHPVKRLTILAHHLATDELLEDAGKIAHAEMHKALDAAQARYGEEIKTARNTVLTVEGRTLRADLKRGNRTFNEFYEDADLAVVEDAYKRAARVISPDVAHTYAEYLAAKNEDADSVEEALMDSHADVAGMGLVSEVKTYLDAEADKLATKWLDEYRIDIKNLSDAKQDVYRQIRGMSKDPQAIGLSQPNSWMEPTKIREANGEERPLPRYGQHLLCDNEGQFPADLNSWESEVLKHEMNRKGFAAWYRNPARASQDSLGVAYWTGDEYKLVRPDFLFFAEQSDGRIAADLVDPHGTYLSDSLPKLRGLADYADVYGGSYRRIDAVAKVGETLRVLELTDPDVRAAVRNATDAKGLYDSKLARDF